MSPVSGYFDASLWATLAARCSCHSVREPVSARTRLRARRRRRLRSPSAVARARPCRRQFVEQRGAIRDTHVAPHLRARRGDPREVAKTARRERKFQRGVGRIENLLDQRERQHMRQMADRREHAVVLLRRHFADQRTVQPHRRNALDRLRRVLRQRTQHDIAADVQIGQRGIHAARLPPRNRMPRHELADPRAERCTRRGDHVGLRAARVGDDRAGIEKRRDAFEQRQRLRDRRRQQHESAPDSAARNAASSFNAAAPSITPNSSARSLDAGRTPHTDNSALAVNLAALTQCARERSADQADTKNHQLVK